MNILNKIITETHKFVSKYPFILNSIKKILKLCPYLEKKISNTINSQNKNDKILLTRTGQEIFDIISSSKFEKKSKNKQKIDNILIAIDDIFRNEIRDKQLILQKISNIISKDYDDYELRQIAQRTAEYLYERRENYIFIDLSILAINDSGTGIQRVCKQIFNFLPNLSKYKVIPVHSPQNEFEKYGFRYCSKLAEDKERENEEVIEFIDGDILFFPELSIEQNMGKKEYLEFLKTKGVKIIFFIHDLIPIEYPETCTQTIKELFPKYINSALDYGNGAICNSQSTANDLKKFIKENRTNKIENFKIEWIHLGSDFEKNISSTEIPEDSNIVFNEMERRITFLTVSTIEPRKMYNQIFEAFEILWDKNQDVNLVIVGKNGWNTEKLVEKIENHKELNKRLFKLSGINDEYLNKIYEKSSALIMASKAEGFGLGIIEATYHKKPLIIRDIPVFREIAGENAFYFTGFEGKDLANAIEKWIPLYKENKHPKSDDIKYLTWKESVQMLNEKLELITK